MAADGAVRKIIHVREWFAALSTRRRESDNRRKRNPVRVFAIEVATIDDIDVESIDRPETQTQLESCLRHARRIRDAGQTEHLTCERPNIIGGSQINARAVEQVVPIDGAVPLPTGIQIDTRDFRKPQRCR